MNWEECVVVGRGRRGRGRSWPRRRNTEREDVFHERDVPRCVDATGDDVVAAIAAVIAGVAEEDASHRAGTELVRRHGRGFGVAETAENAEFIIARGNTKKQMVRRDLPGGATGTPVDEVRRRVQSFSPKGEGSCTVKKQSTYTVVNGAQNPLGLAVLLGSVWTGEAERRALNREEGAQGNVVIFSAVVGPISDDGKPELCGYIRKEGTDDVGNIGLLSNRVCPNIMSVSINEHNIVFVTGMTVNRRCPHIRMHKLKREICRSV